MRKLATLALLLLVSVAAKAQIPAVAYTFSAASKTYTPITTGTNFSFNSCDDGYYQNIPLGFTFTFCGVNYTQISASSNGFICFANTATGTTGNYNGSGIEPAAFPLHDDISGCRTGTNASQASYLTSGTPGSQIFTLQWSNWTWYYNTSSTAPNVINFQVKLYEATGRVEFMYEQGPDGINGSTSASIGISKSSSDYLTLTGTSTAPGVWTPSNGFYTSINARPASGQSYMFDPPPPCPAITPITLAGFNSQAVSYSWASAAGAANYEYAIDNNADRFPASATVINTTTGTSASATGLTASTKYYIHVRSKCSQYSFSKWDTVSFTTLPPCSKPGRIVTSYIDSTSIKFSWPGVPAATTYQYFIDSVSKAAPTSAVGATPSTTGFIDLTNLKEGKTYYVKYRSLCASKDSSGWAIDSFKIPVPCRRPILELLTLNSQRAIVQWKPVNTAVLYEYYYAAGSSAPPAFGTPTAATIVQMALAPFTLYDLHVRCSCSYFGISTVSGWSTLEFQTLPPLEINNVAGSDNELSVYPNPVKNVLNVNITGTINKDASIVITDVKGQVIKQIEANANKLTIDAHELTPGLYLIKYNNGEIHKTIKVTKE